MANVYTGLRVEIAGELSEREWIELKVVMDTSKHEVGYIIQRHYLGRNSRLSGRTFYKKGSRISVLFGEFPTRGFSRQFRGYITNHQATDPAKDKGGQYIDVTYFLIGTSKPLQAKNNWKGMSWSGAARAIAKRHKLKPVIHKTPKLSKPLIQNKSDFKFLVEGAEKTGYRFLVSGTTLYFVNPQRMLNSRPTGTPVFEGGAIRDITIEGGSAGDDEVWESSGVGITGEPVFVRSPRPEEDQEYDESGAPSIRYDEMVVESIAEAQQAVEARVLSDKAWVTASVETDGDARVLPGLVVYLAGSELPADDVGLWLVEKVTHKVNIRKNQAVSNYSMDMEVSRDRLRSVNLPVTDTVEDTFYDADDVEGEGVPWEASAEWLDSNYEDDAVEVNGVWVAEYYGDGNDDVW